MRFGMPTLIETNTIEECAALCVEAGLSFVEMNMNLPQYQVQTMDAAHLKAVAGAYGIGYTIHLDENMNVADFNPDVAAAYRNSVVQTIELAKRLEIPVLNMHLIYGVYFTLPDRKVYLFEQYREDYRDNMLRFRDACQQAIGGSGIRVCVENWHGYRPWQLGILDEMLESPAFGLTYDVGHNHCIGGADEPHIFARLSKLHHMHLHDVRDGTRDHQALGTGELDIHKYLELAKERDCSVVVETKTIEGLKESARWLHRNL
ncbi:MAG: sugar phosphate isomerase/epimerase [Firmicutes bacterium]|nr:sugar phosphate isomerase/epimerase [Bacillota bacterium]